MDSMYEERQYAIYIMGNERPTLYVGMTNNLVKRVDDHKKGKGGAFTKKYKLNKLLYYEVGDRPMSAIIYEKQLKNMSRKEKLELIAERNPLFVDLWSEIVNGIDFPDDGIPDIHPPK